MVSVRLQPVRTCNDCVFLKKRKEKEQVSENEDYNIGLGFNVGEELKDCTIIVERGNSWIQKA